MGLINRMAESIRSGIKNFLQITPASDKTITVTETSNHLTECFINRIWYWGNSKQLAELYRQIDTNKTMFWAAKSTKGLEIRKIHTGLPALICETLVNIVIADYNGTDVTSKNSTAYAERWEDIEKQNKLSDTVKQMLRDLCVVGDGAFKVSFDTAVSDVPIVEWYPAENIDFTYVRGRIREVKFYTDYTQNTAVTVLKKHTVTAIFTMLCTMTTAKRLTCTRLTLFRGLIQRALHLTNHICGLYLSFTANRATRAEVRALSA